MVEWLTLVDDFDNVLGTDTRENCHEGRGKRHRAFVLLLFDKEKRMLLQRRSQTKQLWPGYWDVSATSHVYATETYEEAAQRTLRRELGVDEIKLDRILGFTYWAPFNTYSENEYCSLMTGDIRTPVRPNPLEISEYKFSSLAETGQHLTDEPEAYTPWFRIAYNEFSKDLRAAKYFG